MSAKPQAAVLAPLNGGDEALAVLLNVLSQGVLVVDLNARVVNVNPAAARILALPTERLLRQRLNGLSLPAAFRRLWRGYAVGRAQERLMEYVLSTGEVRSLHVRQAPLSDGGLIELTDVTETARLRAEASANSRAATELQEAHKELLFALELADIELEETREELRLLAVLIERLLQENRTLIEANQQLVHNGG